MTENPSVGKVSTDRSSESAPRPRRPWRRPTLRKDDIKEATRGLFPLLTMFDDASPLP